jgi:uncharacterized protein (TIGR00369 family)
VNEIKDVNERSRGFLQEHLGIRFTALGEGWVEAELPVTGKVMAPNGFLHAGAVVSLADSACGQGCIEALPAGASGFTTVELKSNFLGTALEGAIAARADLVHAGRTTQVWDARVTRKADGKTIALFRCTQMILWPRASG